ACSRNRAKRRTRTRIAVRMPRTVLPRIVGAGFTRPAQPPRLVGAGFIRPVQPPRLVGAGFIRPAQPPRLVGAGFIRPAQPPRLVGARFIRPAQPPRLVGAGFIRPAQPPRVERYTCTSRPESSARSTVRRVPPDEPSQNATSASAWS